MTVLRMSNQPCQKLVEDLVVLVVLSKYVQNMYLNHKELSKYGSHGLQQCLKLKFFLKNFYQYQIKNRPTKTKYVLSFQLILRTWSLFPFFIESALKKAWKK